MTSISMHSSGPPETILQPESPEAMSALALALDVPVAQRRDALADVVSRWPRFLEGWARLGDYGRDPIERYAAYRAGYHRGLDTLRQNGWRGSGYVRWEHQNNRGFLGALAGLEEMARQIGELDEAERCSHFLQQLDPTWPPTDIRGLIDGARE